MRISGFIWFDEVTEKIETKHFTDMPEVEAVFDDRPKFKKMHRGKFRGEDVYRALGQTQDGRYLSVFFIHKLTQKALILSARDMDDKERSNYGKK
jgi:hypothetical protein